jgi:lysophospholipase L1-like esterase
MPIPNLAGAGFTAQAEPDSGDFTILESANAGYGVASGLVCTPAASGSTLGVAVAAGVAYIGKIQVPVVAATVTPGAASGSNPRIDLVTVDATGLLAIVAGTAAANPIFPTIPAAKAVLCAVWIPTSATSITAANISDKRQMVDYGLGDLTAPGSPYLVGQSMRGWRAGWAKRTTQPVNILLLGNSNTTGYWATTDANRWAQIFATMMETANGQRHTLGYQSAHSLVNYTAGQWTVVGATTDVATSGLGYGAATIAGTGTSGSRSATQMCDRFWVRYQTATAAGAFTISIDGVVAATIAASAGAVVGGLTWDSGPLPLALHTVKLTSTTTTTPIVEGIYWFWGNGNTVGTQGTLSAANSQTGLGVRVLSGPKFGSAASDFSVIAPSGDWWTAGLDRFPPHVVVMAWGTNELGGVVAPATFRTNLGLICARILTVMSTAGKPPPAFVFIVPHGTGTLTTDILPYRKAIYQAAVDNGASVIDRNAMMGNLDNATADPWGFGSGFDGATGRKHLDDPGMRVAAETTANFLLNADSPPIEDTATPIPGARIPVTAGLPRPGRLVICGHSYSTGTGATRPDGQLENSYGWHAILRDTLGGPSYLGFGINGAVSFRKPNGFTSVLQGITSLRTTGSASAMPNAGVYAMHIGLNDLSSVVGGIINNAAGFKTWETAIANYMLRPMQSVVIEDSDAAWTYTGAGWGASVPTTSYSGASIRAVTSHTALTSCSITVPSWFDGKFVHLALIGANTAPTSVAIKVNGTTVQTVDLSGRGNNSIDSTQDISYPIRIAAKASDIVLAEVGAGGGAGGFLKLDYLALEANPRPVVLFSNICRLNTYATFWANITDQMVYDFNADTKALIAAYKAQTLAADPTDTMSELVYVDMDAAINKDPKCFYTDNTHPSARGHAIMAETYLTAYIGAAARPMSVVGGGNKSLALVNGKDIGNPDPLFGSGNKMLVSPSTGTAFDSWGTSLAAPVGTITHPAVTELLGRRAVATTVAAATAGISSTDAVWLRGSLVNVNCGIFFQCRVGLPDASYANSGVTTGSRIFCGLTDQTFATMLATDNPAGNRVGFQYCNVNAGRVQTTWNYNNKDGTTEALIDTLVPMTQNAMYDFYVYIPPNGLLIQFQIDNLTAGTSLMTQQPLNLPTTTVPMRAMIGITSINAVNRGIAIYRMSVSTPSTQWPDTG